MGKVLRLLFGLRERVGRVPYAIAGFGLMTVKYAIDATLMKVVSGRNFMPWDYLNPVVTSRMEGLGGEYGELFWSMVLITLPFVWIGASMTVRRARDAGLPSAIGLLFFVPIVNYLLMILLCFLPSKPAVLNPYGGAPIDDGTLAPSVRSALLAAAAGAFFAVAMVVFSLYVLGDYGTPLFIGSPFVVGVVAAVLANRPTRVKVWHSQGIAQLALVLSGGVILLFALEGVFCLVMAWPIAAVLTSLGAFLGHALARDPSTLRPATISPLWVLALAWPLLGLAERPGSGETPLRAVVTTEIIDAAPAAIWPNVIGFSELPPAGEWLFGLGVAYPQRARIEGEGVGAIRYCEFSTGPFVEPITAWEPPSRLAFDVSAQPPALRELSPYEISAPHLDGFLQSRRGEFLLRALPDGRTELVGTTWYEVHIGPGWYWQLYADAIIHQIHRRVLRHIRNLSEA